MKVMRERTRAVLVSGRCTENMEVMRERTSVVHLTHLKCEKTKT
jgi:hypothetical protein